MITNCCVVRIHHQSTSRDENLVGTTVITNNDSVSISQRPDPGHGHRVIRRVGTVTDEVCIRHGHASVIAQDQRITGSQVSSVNGIRVIEQGPRVLNQQFIIGGDARNTDEGVGVRGSACSNGQVCRR